MQIKEMFEKDIDRDMAVRLFAHGDGTVAYCHEYQ